MAQIEKQMTDKLNSSLNPQVMELVNESHLHGRPPGAETHFKLLVVSSKFEGLSRIDRQRLVNDLFDQERAQGLHALSIRTLSPTEWVVQKDNFEFKSPECQHKN